MPVHAAAIAVAVLAARLAAAPPAATKGDSRPLEPGQTVERAMEAGAAHFYDIQLDRGQFVRIVVDQRGIDVVVSVADAEGRELIVSDSQTGTYGAETVCFIAQRSGRHRIGLRSFAREALPGRYEVSFADLRRPTAADHVRAAASKAYSRALKLENEPSETSKRRSLEVYRESARAWHSAGETGQEALALFALAYRLRLRGEVREATRLNGIVVSMARAAGNRHLQAAALSGLSWDRSRSGDPSGGVEAAGSAVEMARSAGNLETEMFALAAQAFALYGLGRLQEALDADRLSFGLAQRLRHREGQAWASLGIGNAYSALGESYQALHAFDTARELFRAGGSGLGLTLSLQSAGFLAWRIGAHRKALSLYEESLSLATASGNQATEAFARNNIGLVRLTLGELPAARRELEQAIVLWRQSGDVTGQGLSLHNLGKVFELGGDGKRSLGLYGEALSIFRKSGDRDAQARVLASIAHGEAASGRLDEALSRIDQSLEILDAMSRQAATSSLRGSFLAQRQNAYAIGVDILARLDAERPGQGFAARAFQASERARARALVESVTESRLDLARELPEDLRQREAAVSGRLAKLQRDAASSPDRTAAEEAIARAEEEWEVLIAEVRRRTPQYASLRYPEPITYEAARAQLDPRTAIVSFSATGERVLVFVLTAEKIEIVPLDVSPDDAAESVENYVGLIARDSASAWTDLSEKLARSLVDPWRSRLPSGVHRLILVPDGALHSLPFEALRGDRGRPLVETMVVSYAPSVTVLAALKKPGVKAGRRAPVAMLVVADPALPKSLAGQGASIDGETFDLPPLHHASAEAKEVSRHGGEGSELDLGAAASEARLKKGGLERFGVLHFATHALLSRRVPARSALLLAAGEGGTEDGLLQAREVYRLHLQSDLVSLSACRTARGSILPGEGVQGLAQAFFHAGARSLVASLWDVNDSRTAELMAALYRHLAAGEPKADALRAAKLDLLRREPNLAPRFWAPFVLIGEPAETVPLRPVPWWRRLFR